jgi:hypothetical protein
MRKIFALALLCAGSIFAQADIYTVQTQLTLPASTAGALSVQLPTTGANQSEIIEAIAQCLDTQCDIRAEVNGAGASVGTGATQETPAALDPETAPATPISSRITAWSGTGTTIPAGTPIGSPSTGWRSGATGIMSFGGGRRLTGAGQTRNYTLRVLGTHTGTVVRLYISVRVRR